MTRGAAAAVAAAALALAAGCGGADEAQDEPLVSYRVSAPVARFPAHQRLAHPVELTIAVENTGRRTIPDIAATLQTGGEEAPVAAFSQQSDEPGLSSRSRPVWIVDQGPLSGETAFGSTWALGSLRPGDRKTFTWRVVPVRAGRYELRYRLFGSTSGRSRLRTADGAAPQGSVEVRISGKPDQARVTQDGRIVVVPG